MQGEQDPSCSLALKSYFEGRYSLPSASLSGPSPEREALLLQKLDAVDGFAVDPSFLRDLRMYHKFVYKRKVACTPDQNEKAIQGFLERNCQCRQDGGYRFIAAGLEFSRTRSHRRRAKESSGPVQQKTDVIVCDPTLEESVIVPPSGSDNDVNCDVLGIIAATAKAIAQCISRHYDGPEKPKHGPGTTFYKADTKIEKYRYLERDVPTRMWKRFSDFFKPSPSSEDITPFRTDSVCRVSAVPKDARGPRLVAPHLASAMWMQQAVLGGIRSALERCQIVQHFSPLWEDTVQSIQLNDQNINRVLALYASESPSMYATVDMKDASDLVSWKLVCYLLGGTRLLQDLSAIRAYYVKTRAGNERIHMHAPMGSAVCFPVMAIVLWSISVSLMYFGANTEDALRRRVPSMKELIWAEKPFVFGDDVILPPQHVESYSDVCRLAGLVVNRRKTFSRSGGFRESCGWDCYRGVLVTPILYKTGGTSSVSDITSLVTLRNRLLVPYPIVADAVERSLIDNIRFRGGAATVAYTTLPYQNSLLYCGGSDYSDIAICVRLNRKLGVLLRHNPNLQRVEALVLREVEEVGKVDERLDSRARLYEALTGRSNGVSIREILQGVGCQSDEGLTEEWGRKTLRVRAVWMAIC